MSEFGGFEEMMMVEGEDCENEYENEDTNTFQNENVHSEENEYYQDHDTKMISILDEKYQCNKCPKLFSNTDELFRHDATIHNDDKPFKCNLCEKTFGRKDYLTTHERIHLGIKPFKCSFCKKSFGRKHHLTVHEAIHIRNKIYQCMLCRKAFSERHKLSNHICIQIEEKPFECPHCGSKFAVKNYLMKHIKRYHKNVGIPDSLESYECSTEIGSLNQDFSIGENFGNESNLNFVKIEPHEPHEPHNQSNPGEKPFRCEHCGSKFALRTYMMRHMRRIHNIYQTRRPPPQIAPSVDIKPNVQKIEDPLEEDDLDVKYDLTGNDDLAIEKPWKCQLCTSEFTRKPYLMKHIKRMHIDRMDYVVVSSPNVNNQNSTDIEQLEIEPDLPSIGDESEDDPTDFLDVPVNEDSIQESQIMFQSTPNKVDNAEKPWKCEYCISEFSRKSYMMKHMKRMHKMSNTPAVDIMNDAVSFNTQESDVEQLEVEPDFPQIEIGNEPVDNLIVIPEEEDINDFNSLTNENDVEEDDVANEIEIFPDTSAMLNLIWGSQDEARNNASSSGNEAEKRYTCSFCDRSFKRRDTLITHERIHTGEKPFKCQQCGKAFARKDYLTKHERQHVEGVVHIPIKPPIPPAPPKEQLLPGEKPFKCDICPGSFTQKKNLARHLKHVHKLQRSSNVTILPTDNYISNGVIDIVDNDGLIDVNNIKEEVEDDNGNETESYSQLHILDETNEKPHKCNYCEKRFRQRYLKETHERIHLGIKPFKCDLCTKQFTRKDHLNIHARLHSEDRQFSCSYCPKSFLQRKDVYIHEQTHTVEKPFECEYCRSRFAVRSYMMKHMRRVHKNILAASTSGRSFNKTNTIIVKEEQEIVNEPIIDDDDDDEDDYPTDEIEKTEITDMQENFDEGDDQELKEDKAYECEECDKSELFDITGLVRHILEIHTTTSKCQICVKSFYSKKELQRHLKAIHLDERPFTCRICFKCFSRPYFLRQHERTHFGIKPFGCSTCDKHFFTAALLADHERIHTGERPFNCQFCLESFRVKSDLTQHEKIHGVSKGFDCDQCHMSFSRNYNLIRHKNIHKRKLSCPM